MASPIDSATEFAKGIDISGSISILAWFAIGILIAGVVGVIVYLIIREWKFNKKIIVFEKVNGKPEITKRDKAMEVKLGEGGDTVFYLKKAKKHIPLPSIQTGRNIYWFGVREDGEWINIGMDDIDLAMRKIKARFVDKEMRYARVALQRNLKERYQKSSFLSVYGEVR